MTQDDAGTELSIEELRERYRIEKEKRLRPEGKAQYQELTGDLADFDRDPYADPDFTRDPVDEEITALIVGGGFGGMLTAVNLTKLGMTDYRLVEKGGDFGGTWYWNRYPGCQCDVESYTYLPLLEETGYMPTERYASAAEIFEYCQLIGRHFGLYDHALFQTVIDTAEWDEDAARWIVTTNRGDTFRTRFLVTAGGLLHKAKLPGIPGIQNYTGKAFHTSRWDYSYTGGGPREPMEKLRGKRVGIIGTGATAIQVVPQLAKVVDELYVFQRTPAAVGVRGNRPTDVEWFRSLKPGWQAERIANFTKAVTGQQPEEDLIDDGWTHAMWENTQLQVPDPAEAERLERSDFETMEAFRRRVDELVEDPETAAKLKPWWGKFCKRLCFHDEYLPTFNQPNVHLVDTDGRGVDAITENGPVVDGVEYPVDLLVFASGFEVGTDFMLGFDPKGRNGVGLLDSWGNGAHTLHGILSSDFPNLMVISLVQAGFGTNFVHFLSESTEHVANVIAVCVDQDVRSIEPDPAAEEQWLMTLWTVASEIAGYSNFCTPSYYNSEQGEITEKSSKNLVYTGPLTDYAKHLHTWRESGMPGAKLVRADA
jgi:cation diffusion facilitator CzcD-associated flavoprotein CzcO